MELNYDSNIPSVVFEEEKEEDEDEFSKSSLKKNQELQTRKEY